MCVAAESWSFYLLQRVFNSSLEILPVQQQRIAFWNFLVKISLLVLLHQERVCLEDRGAHSQDFGGFLHLVRKVYTTNMIFTNMTTINYKFIVIVTWSGEQPSVTASPCVRTLRRQTRVDRVAGTLGTGNIGNIWNIRNSNGNNQHWDVEILERTIKTTYLANIGEWKERRDRWKGTMAPSTVTRDTYFSIAVCKSLCVCLCICPKTCHFDFFLAWNQLRVRQPWGHDPEIPLDWDPSSGPKIPKFSTILLTVKYRIDTV